MPASENLQRSGAQKVGRSVCSADGLILGPPHKAAFVVHVFCHMNRGAKKADL